MVLRHLPFCRSLFVQTLLQLFLQLFERSLVTIPSLTFQLHLTLFSVLTRFERLHYEIHHWTIFQEHHRFSGRFAVRSVSFQPNYHNLNKSYLYLLRAGSPYPKRGRPLSCLPSVLSFLHQASQHPLQQVDLSLILP